MRLFQYAIIHIPKGQSNAPKVATVLKDITSVLATDEKSALLIAARQIPEDYLDRLGDIEVALRPF